MLLIVQLTLLTQQSIGIDTILQSDIEVVIWGEMIHNPIDCIYVNGLYSYVNGLYSYVNGLYSYSI